MAFDSSPQLGRTKRSSTSSRAAMRWFALTFMKTPPAGGAPPPPPRRKARPRPLDEHLLQEVLARRRHPVEAVPGKVLHQVAEAIPPHPPPEARGRWVEADHPGHHLVGFLLPVLRSVGGQSHHLVLVLELAHPQKEGDEAVEAPQ